MNFKKSKAPRAPMAPMPEEAHFKTLCCDKARRQMLSMNEEELTAYTRQYIEAEKMLKAAMPEKEWRRKWSFHTFQHFEFNWSCFARLGNGERYFQIKRGEA